MYNSAADTDLYDLFAEEKIFGKIYLMARPDGAHMDIQGNIYNIFENYFRKNHRNCGARIEDEVYFNENNYVIPDVRIFCYNKTGEKTGIIVEVLSKSTRVKDLSVKMKLYAEMGVKEYWIITPETFSIDIYSLKDNGYELYAAYSLFFEKDFPRSKKAREEQEKTVIKEFAPILFPDLVIEIEDVFYRVANREELYNNAPDYEF